MSSTAIPAEKLQKQLAIIGLGLMGSSLGLAARACGWQVSAYARRTASIQAAIKNGIADCGSDNVTEAVKDADLVVLCTPLLTMPELTLKFRKSLKPGCIITDVGSTKLFLAKVMEELMKDIPAEYIGSHPMAGSDRTGLEAAAPDLYKNASVIITPDSQTSDTAQKYVTNFWQELGSKVTAMSPEAHDRAVARTSHLPHLTASALMATVDRDQSDIKPFCGPGILDTTRIAAGSETIWHDIIKTNREPIMQELQELRQTLDSIKQMLASEDFQGIKTFLAESRRKRMRLQAPDTSAL
jgi:prephenate dehydrogenase